MRSVFEIIDRKTEVELKHVDLAYPTGPDVQVLRDLSLRARAGKTLALAGPSGCGKSSVLPLVLRFYEPSSGRVLLDGKDVRKYNLRALRRWCRRSRSCSQANAHKLSRSCSQANAHKFISALPEGYRTQRQRILKKAPIMLLDEATSALDAESERCVQEALDRLATVRGAHSIAVIDDGTVVEQGSHSHLLKHHPDGCYARMLQLQRLTTGAAPGDGAGASSSSAS